MSKVENPVFIFFSDDQKWVKENFKGKNYLFVDWNNKQNSWQDMALMSKCKHNIIANSTFSWWGAYLNSNKGKIIISPSKFLKYNKNDIIPEKWIKI